MEIYTQDVLIVYTQVHFIIIQLYKQYSFSRNGPINHTWHSVSTAVQSFIFAFSYVILTYTKPVQFIFLLAYIPLCIHSIFVYNTREEYKLDGELKKVALSTFLFAILLGLGQVL